MCNEINVIWKKGDGEIPEKAKHIVNAAQDELLLRSLSLSHDTVNTIRYNASKNLQSVSDYISTIITGHITTPKPQNPNTDNPTAQPHYAPA